MKLGGDSIQPGDPFVVTTWPRLKRQIQAHLLAAAVLMAGLWLEPSAAQTQRDGPLQTRSTQLVGRAGIYYRVSKHDRGLNLNHPLVDFVVLTVPWASIEPRKGEFQLGELRRIVTTWGKAGKGVVINTPLYGQAPDDSITPPWIYEEGARRVSFRGGGRAKGHVISIPAVWEPGFVEEFLAPLVSALTEEVAGNPHVQYLMPAFGHIGNINTQPSKRGAPAVKSLGWTPEKWKEYVDRVTTLYREKAPGIPLITKSASMLLRDPPASNYSEHADEILSSLGNRGISIISLGLSSSLQEVKRIRQRVTSVSPSARLGAIRIGFGDDWPLWVPEERRGRRATLGRDAKSLENMARLIFDGSDGISDTPVTILYCQEPEISASNPGHPAYREEVFRIIRDMRRSLLVNDTLIFGGGNAKNAAD